MGGCKWFYQFAAQDYSTRTAKTDNCSTGSAVSQIVSLQYIKQQNTHRMRAFPLLTHPLHLCSKPLGRFFKDGHGRLLHHSSSSLLSFLYSNVSGSPLWSHRFLVSRRKPGCVFCVTIALLRQTSINESAVCAFLDVGAPSDKAILELWYRKTHSHAHTGL